MGLPDNPEDTILGWADPNDRNADGVSGRPNYVWMPTIIAWPSARFGWKANQPNVVQQVAAAFSGDMGITTKLFPPRAV